MEGLDVRRVADGYETASEAASAIHASSGRRHEWKNETRALGEVTKYRVGIFMGLPMVDTRLNLRAVLLLDLVYLGFLATSSLSG